MLANIVVKRTPKFNNNNSSSNNNNNQSRSKIPQMHQSRQDLLLQEQDGVDEIRIPGERSYRMREQLRRDGIEIDRKIYDALGRLAEGQHNHGADPA